MGSVACLAHSLEKRMQEGYLELDSTVAIQLIANVTKTINVANRLINDIRKMLELV